MMSVLHMKTSFQAESQTTNNRVLNPSVVHFDQTSIVIRAGSIGDASDVIA